MDGRALELARAGNVYCPSGSCVNKIIAWTEIDTENTFYCKTCKSKYCALCKEKVPDPESPHPPNCPVIKINSVSVSAWEYSLKAIHAALLDCFEPKNQSPAAQRRATDLLGKRSEEIGKAYINLMKEMEEIEGKKKEKKLSEGWETIELA